MTNYRCINCELLWDERELAAGAAYCKTCEKDIPNRQLGRLEGIFNDYCKEIFQLRYPDEPNDHFSSVDIPSDYWARKKLVQTKKKDLEKRTKSYEESMEVYKKRNEQAREYQRKGGTHYQLYEKEIKSNNEKIEDVNFALNQLKKQQSHVLQLEYKYNQ